MGAFGGKRHFSPLSVDEEIWDDGYKRRNFLRPIIDIMLRSALRTRKTRIMAQIRRSVAFRTFSTTVRGSSVYWLVWACSVTGYLSQPPECCLEIIRAASSRGPVRAVAIWRANVYGRLVTRLPRSARNDAQGFWSDAIPLRLAREGSSSQRPIIPIGRLRHVWRKPRNDASFSI